jgi:hypothetical protein
MPGSLYELIKALLHAPVGSWLSVNLAALPGSTPAAKQSSTARAARRQFNPVQTRIKGSRLFVRRLPDPKSYPPPPHCPGSGKRRDHDLMARPTGGHQALNGGVLAIDDLDEERYRNVCRASELAKRVGTKGGACQKLRAFENIFKINRSEGILEGIYL